MAMKSVVFREPFDREVPLKDEKMEAFCQEYIRLDLEEGIKQAMARRIMAVKFSFPEYIDRTDEASNKRGHQLLSREDVSERLEFLYEQMGSGVENKVKWTKMKAEDTLLELIFAPDTKNPDKLKAIAMLNEIRSIGAEDKKDKDSLVDSVAEFFNKLKG